MQETRILGIQINKREENAIRVQEVMTLYGCSIKTRLGLHEIHQGQCSQAGLILLELTGDTLEADRLEAALREIPEIIVRRMDFPLPS